jgi:3-oxoadipate CoA-transferase, alpha subunit
VRILLWSAAVLLVLSEAEGPPLLRSQAPQGRCRFKPGLDQAVHPSYAVRSMKQKICENLDAAVADVPDGARIMFGGFGGAGFPNNLIQALARKGTKDITAISNNCGTREGELGILFKLGRIRHVIASFPGPHSNYFQEQFAAGKVSIELVPQGILCERMRAAAAGLLGFYTTVGVGTEVAAGKEERVIDGKRCILESPIHADYAFIKAQTADELGNLTYRLAARNFNPIMAMAAKTTVVEVEEIVPVGSINPEHVITPAIFVHRIVQAQGLRYAG